MSWPLAVSAGPADSK